jgi:hypothetical protein
MSVIKLEITGETDDDYIIKVTKDSGACIFILIPKDFEDIVLIEKGFMGLNLVTSGHYY